MIVDKYTKHSVMKVKIIKDYVLKGYEPIRKKNIELGIKLQDDKIHQEK